MRERMQGAEFTVADSAHCPTLFTFLVQSSSTTTLISGEKEDPFPAAFSLVHGLMLLYIHLHISHISEFVLVQSLICERLKDFEGKNVVK